MIAISSPLAASSKNGDMNLACYNAKPPSSLRSTTSPTSAGKFTYIGWEKGHTKPYAPSYPAIIAFLGYDPLPQPTSLKERVQRKRQRLGVTFSRAAQYLGWDEGSLSRYLN